MPTLSSAQVKPASGVPGECYTLADRLELALAVDDDETLDEEEDAHEDEQDEKYGRNYIFSDTYS